MTLTEFIECSTANKIENTNNWSVEIILKNNTETNLTVIDCSSEYEAKERIFLFLNERIIQNRNKQNNRYEKF